MPHVLRIFVASIALLTLSGCQSYQLRGIVVEGASPMVAVVNADDPRLNSIGLAGAVVEATIDPRSIRPKSFPAVTTDDQGNFVLPIGETGAGFLEYDVLLVARTPGFRSASEMMPLPPHNRRLLIVLAPGRDASPQRRDIVEETVELGRQLQE